MGWWTGLPLNGPKRRATSWNVCGVSFWPRTAIT